MTRIDKAFLNLAKQHLRWAKGGTVKQLRVATAIGFKAACQKAINIFNGGTAREILAREALVTKLTGPYINVERIQNKQEFAITLAGNKGLFDKDYVIAKTSRDAQEIWYGTGKKNITADMAITVQSLHFWKIAKQHFRWFNCGTAEKTAEDQKAWYGKWLLRLLGKI